MPTWLAIATAQREINWFSAITVTVAPEIASRLAAPASPLPISKRAPANLPTYWRRNASSLLSGIPTSRIGSLCLSTRTPVIVPFVSIPISVTIGLPE